MRSGLPFGLEIPVLYVHPAVNDDLSLIEEVSRAGGIGIVDYAASGLADTQDRISTGHGVRVRLDDLQGLPRQGVKLVLIAYEDADRLAALKPGVLASVHVPVLAEVGCAKEAKAAQAAGAAGLVARGNEGPGWVGPTGGFVLLQELLGASELPLFLRGGVGLHSAAGVVAAGATGVVLDVHLLLTKESGISPALREFLGSLPLPATVTLAEPSGRPLRVYARVGTRKVRELRKEEESLGPNDVAAYHDRLAEALGRPVTSPDSDDALFPLSEDIATAKHLAAEMPTAADIVKAFGRKIATRASSWPFGEDAALCEAHGTRFPIVQGPMAHVSDNPGFLGKVVQEGALPFLAMGNMPGPIAQEGLALSREQTRGRFGVGLIGLEVNRKCYETHLELMAENPPPFAILAAGGPELAQRIESIGTVCYLHCPSPAILAEGLKSGLRHFVFEGCESGGHIGLLGSLDLWNANLHEVERAARDGIDLSEVTVLFAGGIASGKAAAFLAGMLSDFTARGLKAGLQMGTAYLATEEAVSTCAITPTYHRLTVESDGTVIIGRTVNTRARAAGSPMASQLIEREHERLRSGMSLRERKELYEHDNLGALRLASKGCAIDPATATWDCPVFCDLPPEEQLERGLYLMGQVVSLLDGPTTIAQLHAEILDEGRRVFEKYQESMVEDSPQVEVMPEEMPALTVAHEREPIAVVGIGLRFPGANSPDSFWNQIITGRSGIVEVPPERWGKPDFYYDPDPKAPDKSYTRIGGFITDFTFDPLAYRIPPAVAQQMDRTQQLAVACVGDALADAGLSPGDLRGKRVGIVIGNSMGGEKTDVYATRMAAPRAAAALEESLSALNLDGATRMNLVKEFCSRYLCDLPDITEDSLPGELANVISGRVANVFNLEGPNFTVDAACASSMAAVMNAVAALRGGSIDYALSGGVDAAMGPASFVKFCKIGALSPDGSRPFDQGANGFVMGEGAGMMLLKRLSDAVRDGDRIYGTILEVGSSSDGRGKGITAPNASGQERAILAGLEAAGIELPSVGLIEAHGTSTPVGDTTELTVLDKLYRLSGVPAGSIGLGSVKSQIGHLKAASGSAGLIKVLLSLFHRTMPPTINVRKPNPCIEWESSPLRLLTEPRPWNPTSGGPLRAGVSAFGFGGTNFHVILQQHVPGLRVISGQKQAPPPVPVTVKKPEWPKPADMQTAADAWVVGGEDAHTLVARLESLLKELNPSNAAPLAARERDAALGAEIRFAFAATDAESAAAKLAFIVEVVKDPAKKAMLPTRGIHAAAGRGDRAATGIAFVFPGQGSQYPYMLRDLAERFPIVAQTFVEADEVLSSLGLPTVSSTVFLNENSKVSASAQADAMKDTQLLQPMILTANTAILRVLGLMGVRPAAVAGHSLGEYAACVAAGVFSFPDALQAVAVRGREMARVSIADPGLMMSIPADARVVEEVLAEVDGYVVAANKNSPKQTVISGETPAVKKAGELFAARGIEGMLLPVSAAFHSGVVAPAREPFMKTLERLTLHSPSVPVLSNVTGEFYPIGPASPSRIRDLLGKQFAAPVEWVKSLRRLYSEGIRLFLECGPKRVLTNLTLDTLPSDVLALPTNHPKKGGMLQLMEALAALAAEGVPVDFDAADSLPAAAAAEPRATRPVLRVVSEPAKATPPVAEPAAKTAESPLEALLDEEIREIARKIEFKNFLALQGEPIRSLIKSGFKTYVDSILPLEKTVRQVKSEGMDFNPVVISGTSAGLPSDVRFPFDREVLDDLILGRNFIKKVSEDGRRSMLEKNVERLLKGPGGEVDVQMVEDLSGVIKLAGSFTEEDIVHEYGLDERVVRAMDVTTRLAVAAGIEALRDAGIPLVRHNRTTSTGHELPESWTLPHELRAETGIIFASAFPGMASLVDEVTREAAARYGAGAKKRLIDFYTSLLQRVTDDRERERITKWFTEEFARLNLEGSEDLYTFNRDFLLKVISMAHGQLAQLIKAQGPNTHVDAACAGTTQAMLIARDWIRTGQAKRVILVAADDVAGRTLLPWVGSGFLAVGAATTNANVSEAALPFDDRRHGLILGSAAVGVILESSELVKKRGMEPIASIEAGIIANSGYHGTRLDQDHICSVMETMISKWEEQSGSSRQDLAGNVFFMSHETYSPKRGGSSSAEVRALRATFGDKAREIPIANTKGFTGHTMGVGVEDVVALRCLQKGLLPPIPNLRQPDPEFADLNLSRGGTCEATYALRLAAGFGSQVVMSLYKLQSRDENRIVDLATHRNWLKGMTGYTDPVVLVEERTLRVTQRSVEEVARTSREQAPAVPVAVKEVAEPPAKLAAGGASEIRSKILSLLSDKTGYPADMLDTGLDLEADLGIDTVKQAEFITEVREAFEIPRIEGLKIAEFPTIEHIIRFVMQHTEASQPSAGADAAEGPMAQAVGSASAGDQDEVREKILGLLSQKTGYPADMLDTGLDLEADLGIDTVKQAEFITEVRETFGIPRIEGLKIADFPTINHIIHFVIERTRESAPAVEAPKEDAKEAAVQIAEAEVRLLEARLVALPPRASIALPEVDEVLIAGGPADTMEAVEAALRSAGYDSILRVTEGAIPQELKEKRIGVINLFPMEEESSPTRTFELCLSLALTFDQGPAFLVSAVSEDGAYGFENPTAEGYKAGIASGATKSFAREYPDARVRMLDLHPGLSRADQAEFILRSLHETFPLETGVGADGRLTTVRLVPHVEEIAEPGTRPGDVVLASGGAGGITAACIRRLAEQHPLTFVILDRTELSNRSEQLASFGPEQWESEKQRIIERMKREGTAPTPVMVEREVGRLKAEADAFKNVRQLKALGSEVIFRSLDIRDGEAVDRAIEDAGDLCGRIDVVIHAAGIDISRALRSKSIEQIENVVSVKVDGMLRILAALKRREMLPRRIVGFGSVAGRFGNLAQIDYSAANDGLAHMLRWADREMDAKASIIDWAPWSQIGMATRGSVQLTLEAAGIDFVSPQQGIEFLFREVGRATPAKEVMAAGRMGPFTPDAFEIPGAEPPEDLHLAGHQAHIENIIPGEYVRAHISLDPSRPLLDHHRIDRAAVLPGVGGMAIMKAAAALLEPEMGSANFEKVRFISPLKIFKNEPFEAEVEVIRVPEVAEGTIAYDARITSRFVDKLGRKMGSPRLHHQCRVVLGSQSEAALPDVADWGQSVRIAEKDIYAIFFHGPGFRFLDHVALEGSGKSVRFRYRDTEHRKAMFSDMIPGAVEAAFQAAAALGLESKSVMALPVGIDRAEILSTESMPYEGELIPVAQTVLDGPEERMVFRFDGVIRNCDGEPIIILKGVEAVELERSNGFPRRVFEEIVAIERVGTAPEGKNPLADALDEEEAREHAGKKVPKRAEEWLSGRVALKKSVGRLLATTAGEAPPLRHVRIVQTDLGKPAAELSHRPGVTVAEVSLSHSNGLAMAAAASPGLFEGLGVDVEKVEARSEGWIGDYFSKDEIRLAGNGEERWTRLTMIWCLKEAALKAMGTGLRFDLKDINVADINPSGRATLEFHNEAARYVDERFHGAFEASVEEKGGIALARVLIRK